MSKETPPIHSYFAWEMGYVAAVYDQEAGADGTPGREFTSNPFGFNGGVPADEV